MFSVGLFNKLQEDLILQLLSGWLAQGNHIFNQSENMIQLRFLTYPHDDFEHFKCSFFVFFIHHCQSFAHRSVFGDHYICIVFRHADKISSFAKYTFKEVISLEVNDFILVLRWCLLNLEDTIFTIRWEELFLTSIYFQFVLFW